MSTDIQRFITLKSIVAFTLDELKKSQADFDRYWIFAFRVLTELMFDISGEPITVRLPVNPNNTCNIPGDCISWVKIGILNNNNEVSTLRINNALTTFKDANPNRQTYLTADITDGFPLLLNSPYYINYFYDGVYQPLFGSGGGLVQYGSCRVDEVNNVIILDEYFQYDHVIFEYISSPEKNGDYTVPLAVRECVIAFIKWKDKQGTYQEYIAEKINARRRMPKKKVTLQEINQVLRESEAFKLRS